MTAPRIFPFEETMSFDDIKLARVNGSSMVANRQYGYDNNVA